MDNMTATSKHPVRMKHHWNIARNSSPLTTLLCPTTNLTVSAKHGVQLRRRLLLVVRPYGMLWEAGNVDAFMDVWVHGLESHHYATHHTALGIVPRGVDAHNLMLTLDRVTCILGNWDLPACVDTTGKISTAQHRTGALPFTALDLLVEKPPPHLYRHDLESFFYILIWAALHYDFENKTRASEVHPAVEPWNSSIMEFGRCTKACVIKSDASEIRAIISQIPPRCQKLVPWIQAIWRLFFRAHINHGFMELDGAGASWDNKTCGGWITFEKYMEAVQVGHMA